MRGGSDVQCREFSLLQGTLGHILGKKREFKGEDANSFQAEKCWQTSCGTSFLCCPSRLNTHIVPVSNFNSIYMAEQQLGGATCMHACVYCKDSFIRSRQVHESRLQTGTSLMSPFIPQLISINQRPQVTFQEIMVMQAISKISSQVKLMKAQ